MAASPEPDLEEQLWTIAVARLVFGPSMSLQAPPNLRPEALSSLVRAGINDWGGVSPVTPDHVNPEAPWPHLEDLERSTNAAGRDLVERLALVPAYAAAPERWTDAAMTPRVRRLSDSLGYARAGPLVFGRERRIAGRSAAVDGRACVTMTRAAARVRGSARSSMRRARAANWRRPMSCGSSARKAAISMRSSRRPTGCARIPSAIRSPTWSIATSTTPTSACTIAASAHSPRVAAAPICAGLPISSTSRKSRVAPARRPTPVRPKCACRAASIPRFTGRDLSGYRAGGQERRPIDSRARLLAAGGQARRRDARAAADGLSRAAARCGTLVAARNGRRNSR